MTGALGIALITQKEMTSTESSNLGIPGADARLAFQEACNAQAQFEKTCSDFGRQALSQVEQHGNALVLIGHPYIIHDRFFNLNIAKRLMNIGIPVVPGDILPLTESQEEASRLDLIWKVNNRALNFADYINHFNRTHESKLLPVVMTTFGCASDSMLTPYLYEVFSSQPWLEIELDEHNSITGILTRCEAFWESVRYGGKRFKSFENSRKLVPSDVSIEDIKREGRTLYVHEFSEAFTSAIDVLQMHGIKAELIHETSTHSNMLGRKLSNEKHCRTYQVLLGDYMATTERDRYDPERSAFMTFGYDEACRLALFKDLHEMVLKDKGAGDVWLFGPTPDDPVDWIKKFGLQLSLDMWEALVAHDYISRYKFETRPYERFKGSTNRAYQDAVETLRQGIAAGNIPIYFRKAMDTIKMVEVQQRDIVKIGVVGDAFTRVHKYSRNSLRRIVIALQFAWWVVFSISVIFFWGAQTTLSMFRQWNPLPLSESALLLITGILAIGLCYLSRSNTQQLQNA